MLAVVSYMMMAMMAALFAQRHGYQVDNNQELVANGLACIAGSFLNSLAASTSPPRCFLMEATGGRTQVSYWCCAKSLPCCCPIDSASPCHLAHNSVKLPVTGASSVRLNDNDRMIQNKSEKNIFKF